MRFWFDIVQCSGNTGRQQVCESRASSGSHDFQSCCHRVGDELYLVALSDAAVPNHVRHYWYFIHLYSFAYCILFYNGNGSIFSVGIKRESKEKTYSVQTFLSGHHPLCSIVAKDSVLVFGTQTKRLLAFSINPTGVQHIGNLQLSFEPVKLQLNSNST